MLSWTQGDPTGNSVAGPFMDPSQDLVDLDLTKLAGTNYQARVTRIAGGFSNPIDAAIIDNKIYVIEYSGSQGVWEITFPHAAIAMTLKQMSRNVGGQIGFSFEAIIGRDYQVQSSTNLLDWSVLEDSIATNSVFQFIGTASNSMQFYRVFSP